MQSRVLQHIIFTGLSLIHIFYKKQKSQYEKLVKSIQDDKNYFSETDIDDQPYYYQYETYKSQVAQKLSLIHISVSQKTHSGTTCPATDSSAPKQAGPLRPRTCSTPSTTPQTPAAVSYTHLLEPDPGNAGVGSVRKGSDFHKQPVRLPAKAGVFLFLCTIIST